MEVRGLPKYGNKGDGESSDDDFSEFLRADFEEYRALGSPSIDSFTMTNTDIYEL